MSSQLTQEVQSDRNMPQHVHFPFMDLPPELRLMVTTEMLHDFRGSMVDIWPLLHISHQLTLEASPAFTYFFNQNLDRVIEAIKILWNTRFKSPLILTHINRGSTVPELIVSIPQSELCLRADMITQAMYQQDFLGMGYAIAFLHPLFTFALHKLTITTHCDEATDSIPTAEIQSMPDHLDEMFAALCETLGIGHVKEISEPVYADDIVPKPFTLVKTVVFDWDSIKQTILDRGVGGLALGMGKKVPCVQTLMGYYRQEWGGERMDEGNTFFELEGWESGETEVDEEYRAVWSKIV